MKKLGILVMAMVLVFGMSGLILAGTENVATVDQDGGTGTVGTVDQTGGDNITGQIVQDWNWYNVGKIVQHEGQDNSAFIDVTAGKLSDSIIFQTDGVDNFAKIYTSDVHNAVARIEQVEGTDNWAFIKQTDGWEEWDGSRAYIYQIPRACGGTPLGENNRAYIEQTSISENDYARITQLGGDSNSATVLQKGVVEP